MSSAAIARSGGFCRYGCRVFGPARTIRFQQPGRADHLVLDQALPSQRLEP